MDIPGAGHDNNVRHISPLLRAVESSFRSNDAHPPDGHHSQHRDHTDRVDATLIHQLANARRTIAELERIANRDDTFACVEVNCPHDEPGTRNHDSANFHPHTDPSRASGETATRLPGAPPPIGQPSVPSAPLPPDPMGAKTMVNYVYVTVPGSLIDIIA